MTSNSIAAPHSAGAADGSAPALLAALPGPAAVVAASGAIVAANAAWQCLVSGHEHPLQMAAVAAGLQEVFAGRAATFSFDYPCHSKGRQRWFRLHAAPLHWQGQRAALVTQTETSVEVIASQSAIEAASHLQAAEQLAGFGTFRAQWVDGQLQELTVSRGLCELLAQPPAPAVVASLVPMLRSDDAAAMWEELQNSLREFGVFYGSCTRAAPSGPRFLEIHAHLVPQAAAAVVLGVVHDVTEQRLRQAAAAQTRTLQRWAGSAIGSWAYDPQARAFALSRETAAILGLADRTLRASAALRLVAFHHRPLALDLLRRAVAAQHGFEIELQLRGPGGQLLWTRISAGGTAPRHGRLQGVLQVIDDRSKVDVALREASLALKLVSRCHEVLVRARDERQLFASLCEAAVEDGSFSGAWIAVPREAGLAPACAVRVPAAVLASEFHWRDASPVGAAIRRKRLRFVPRIDSDTAQSWGRHHAAAGIRGLVAVPLVDGDALFGALVLTLAEERVIAERELETLAGLGRDAGCALAALRARAERAAALARVAEQAQILDQAHDAIIVRDLDHRVLHWNGGAEQIFGWSAAEARGRDLRELVFGRLERFDALDAQLLATGRSSTEARVQRRDGQPIWIQATWTLLRGAGERPDRVLAICRDITDIHATREQILQLNASLERRVQRRTRQLEAVNRELEAFSYSVSHDLKAPLAAIDGFVHVLSERLKGRLEEREAGYLQRVRAGVTNMFTLIDAMLALHQISRGTALERRWVDVTTLAEEIVAELREADRERPCRIRIEDGLSIYGDAALVGTALRNLIGNAWKFSAHKPLVEIEIAEDPHGPAGFTTLRIADRGAGFDAAFAGRLFAPFQRLHPASEFPGTGIGLATVQRIVQRHGGSIRADGVPQTGATFWLSLPLPSAEPDTQRGE